MAFALSRASADEALLGRVASVYSTAGRSVVVDGTNPDTVEPWRYSLGLLGVTPAAYPAIGDGDFAAVTPATLAKLLDVAELSARRLALDAMQDVDQQVDRDSQKWDQLARRWQARIDELAAYCRDTYGIGLPTLSAGLIDLGFQEPRPGGGGEWTECDS
jgi:hypothetical protein